MRSAENAQSSVYRPRRYLLTRNEAAFFRVLAVLIDYPYLISCKVRLADLITCDDRDWHKGAANRIAQKHVDFVITRADSSRIVAAIELDDSSHRSPDRRDRDQFVNGLFRQMAIRLIRIPARWNYDQDAVAAILLEAGLTVSEGNDPSGDSHYSRDWRRPAPPRRGMAPPTPSRTYSHARSYGRPGLRTPRKGRSRRTNASAPRRWTAW
jgi:hypothetical protein